MENSQVGSTQTTEQQKAYPLIEEMTFKAPVNSEEEAYRLFKC